MTLATSSGLRSPVKAIVEPFTTDRGLVMNFVRVSTSQPSLRRLAHRVRILETLDGCGRPADHIGKVRGVLDPGSHRVTGGTSFEGLLAQHRVALCPCPRGAHHKGGNSYRSSNHFTISLSDWPGDRNQIPDRRVIAHSIAQARHSFRSQPCIGRTSVGWFPRSPGLPRPSSRARGRGVRGRPGGPGRPSRRGRRRCRPSPTCARGCSRRSCRCGRSARR